MPDPSTPTPEASEQPKPTGPVTVSPEELATLRTRSQERDQYVNLLQRLQAEFENYQQRNARERERERASMVGGLMTDLLPVLDNLERTTQAAQQKSDMATLLQGVQMVQGQFLELLRRYGVTRISAQDQPFDPNQHEAIAQVPQPDKPANTVLQVVEHGYKLQDRILRPARVVVSTPPSA